MDELIKMCLRQGFDGKKTDLCVKSNAVNRLKPDVPVIAIEMHSPDDLLPMMKTADDAHIFIEASIFYINALYFVTENFPAARIYFIKIVDLLAVGSMASYFESHGINLLPIDGQKLSAIIDDKRYASRYKTWHESWEANSRLFKNLLKGRIANTAVEKGIWLSSGGKCMVCGNIAEQMATCTIVSRTGVMVGLQLCNIHQAEAENHNTLFNYVAEKMGLPAAFLVGAKIHQHNSDTLAMSCEAIRTVLNCEIEKIEGQTITAVRKSGFRLILRQDSLTDYAYNISDPTGEPISRIDSAAHHIVEYGPDHVHKNLSKSKKKAKNKKKVEPSFTYGFAVADLKAIRKLIEEAELNWQASPLRK